MPLLTAECRSGCATDTVTALFQARTLPPDAIGADSLKNTRLAGSGSYQDRDTADLLTEYSKRLFANQAYFRHGEPPPAPKDDRVSLSMLMEFLSMIMALLSSPDEEDEEEHDGGLGRQANSFMPAAAGRRSYGRSGGGVTNATFRNQGPLPAADPRSNPRMQKLAEVAYRNAKGPGSEGGDCLFYVQNAMEARGYKFTRKESAYEAADELAKHPRLKEVTPPSDLRKLPAGAIVVWHKGGDHEYGHIAVALGDGREVSDIVKPQTTRDYGTSCRVFYPV